jgi:hypothetical protein
MKARPMQEGESFGLTDSERALFDCVVSEQTNIAGTEILYYQLSLDTQMNNANGEPVSIRDPLYDEPVKRVYLGPYRIKAYMSYPEIGPQLGVEGFNSTADATAFIPRATLEAAGMPYPSESDILGAWNNYPYWNSSVASAGFKVPNAMFYFAVTDVREEGQLFDTGSFMGFTLTLRRTTQQAPENKIDNLL